MKCDAFLKRARSGRELLERTPVGPWLLTATLLSLNACSPGDSTSHPPTAKQAAPSSPAPGYFPSEPPGILGRRPLISEGDESAAPLRTNESGGFIVERSPDADARRGGQLARAACILCHVFPEPDLINKDSWQKYVLPKMKLYLGVAQLDPEKNEGVQLLKASGLFPPAPMIPKRDWEDIAAYYLDTAPAQIPPQGPRDEIKIGLKHFVPVRPPERRSPPLTTLAVIDPAEHTIFTADATQQSLDVLDPVGRLLASIPVGNISVSLTKTERGIYLSTIGHFFPSEEKRGQLILLESTPQGFARKVLLSNLPRPTHLEFADFNGDGKPDFAMCMFGYLTGRFSWFENLGNDEYREHILFPKAGAIRSIVQDFNHDGSPDIAVLFGQETEGILMFYNDKKGGFTMRELLRKPPSYGHSYFEAVDFNKDGLTDFLVTNGDNGDYTSPPKNYHGIRLYLNQGGDRLKEAFFYPLNGAYKAVARDFDEDGDLDIAAISFFPDYEKSPRESFVYLENQGGLKFSASTFRECISGRWLTMDAADLDGDGDIDIVLGSLIRMPTEVPPFVKDLWEKSGPSVLILKNTLR